MSKIKIITDSSSDIPQRYIDELDIAMAPLTVDIDGELFLDRVEITSKEFFDKLAVCKNFPKTALAGPDMFLKEYRKAKEEGYEGAVVVTIASVASGTYQAAKIAVEMMKEETPEFEITVVDSQALCFAVGLPVIEAAKLAKKGASLQEILDRIHYVLVHFHAYFTVDSLEYLKKGGRISAVKAMLGTMLDLKPILALKDGLVVQVENVRGEKKAMSRMVELIAEQVGDAPLEYVALGHGTVPGKVEFLAKKLDGALGIKEYDTFEVGVVIGAHTGPGFSAVFVINPEITNDWIK